MSIGIAIGTEDRRGGQGADELLRNADMAMYTAKNQGKSRYQLFEPTMHDRAIHRLELKADLQRAVENDEFLLHYQPIMLLAGGIVSGLRGADPLEPPAARPGAAARVHPARGGDRADPAHRTLGPARGVPARRVARGNSGRRTPRCRSR